MPYVDVGREILLTLGIGGAGTPFDAANSYIGIGDSSDATTDAMDDLQAVTNKTYLPMDVGFPVLDGNEMVWQATAATGDANHGWKEFGVFNGNNPPTDVMLSRIVEDLGEKTSGDWTIVFRVQVP